MPVVSAPTEARTMSAATATTGAAARDVVALLVDLVGAI
jgi:hypothetical protein